MVLPPEKGATPTLKPTDKTHRPIYMTAAMVMTVLLAADVLLAQDNPEAVILTEEEFQGDAVEQHNLAATQGDAEAQFSIGRMYATGEGVLKGKDEAQAVRWYRRAADQDYAAAQYHLGVMYAAGRGVLKDEAEAVKWYRLAAEQGHALAQFNLGVMHAAGEGVLKDSVLAHMWYNIAGANGNASARKSRDSLERDMTRAEVSRATELARVCMTSDYQDCAP